MQAERGGEATALLEKALERERLSPDPLNSARIRFALARATRAKSPASARQFAEEAVAGLDVDSPLQKQLKERIDVWLRQTG